MIPINPKQIMQMMGGNGINSQSMIMNALKQKAGNNEILQNAIQMMEKGDEKGVEGIFRNVCKSQNLNPDEIRKNINPNEVIQNMINQFGMK